MGWTQKAKFSMAFCYLCAVWVSVIYSILYILHTVSMTSRYAPQHTVMSNKCFLIHVTPYTFWIVSNLILFIQKTLAICGFGIYGFKSSRMPNLHCNTLKRAPQELRACHRWAPATAATVPPPPPHSCHCQHSRALPPPQPLGTLHSWTRMVFINTVPYYSWISSFTGIRKHIPHEGQGSPVHLYNMVQHILDLMWPFLSWM